MKCHGFHFFFVPQVGLTAGNFYWLSAQRPIPSIPPNTPITPDLQAWIRNGALCVALVVSRPAAASSIVYSNLGVTGTMAAASRPEPVSGGLEIEAADDFILNGVTKISSASFIGLVPLGFSVNDLNVEIYRVFPFDSSPFDGKVPTRVNSPSDVAFAERDLSSGIASFSTSIISNSFTAGNSVLNGINPSPFQNTLGEGPVTGQEVLFNVTSSSCRKSG